MRAIAILACLIAAGCAERYTGPTADQIGQSCGVGGKPFIETWPCVRTGLSPLPIDSDLKAVYFATGDFVAEQVSAGRMSDSEAKLAMAEARQRTNSEAIARQNAAAQRDSVTDAVVLGSILNRGTFTPAPYSAAPTYISGPRSTVMCQRTGPTSVFCS